MTGPYVPTLDEIAKSAEAAIADISRQIGLQASDATAVDTKAAGLFTLSATVLGIAASRVHLDSPERAIAGAAAFAYAMALVLSCIQAIRPRAGFSYGPDPLTLVEILEPYASYGVKVRIAQSLAESREKNVLFLGSKQQWYERALLTIVFLTATLAGMVQLQAIR
jgi:hypothetical protein